MKLKTEKVAIKSIQVNEAEKDKNTAIINDKVSQTDNTKEEPKANEDIDEDDDNEFNFENLIMNLNEMRSKAGNLSFEERKNMLKMWLKIFGNQWAEMKVN